MVLSYGGGFNTKATVECKILKIHDLVVKILKFKILSAKFWIILKFEISPQALTLPEKNFEFSRFCQRRQNLEKHWVLTTIENAMTYYNALCLSLQNIA